MNNTTSTEYASSYAYGTLTAESLNLDTNTKVNYINMDNSKSFEGDNQSVEDYESFDEPHDICVTLDITTNDGFQKKVDIPGVFSYRDDGNVCKFYGEDDEFIARIRSYSITHMTASVQQQQ